MKKRLAKFVSWVGFSALQGERRDHEHPVPRYPIRKHELKKFHKAAYLGDLDTVEVLLLRKKNVVHSRDKKDRTALHLACTSGQSPVVTLLIGWRCDLNARDKEGKTALIKAVQCQKEVCVSILLEQGADPNLADDFENTALHYAVLAGNTSVAAELLRYNADIEAINKYNLTPFLHAVRKNKEEMVKFLIENGANVHAVDKLQRSALMLAVRHDSPDIVKLLLQKGVNADLLDVHGQSAEQYASSNGFKHLYQLIVDYRARRIPNTPPQNSDLGQSSAKESLPSSHTGAENIQEKLQLSSKDNEEEKVVELGTSNGSCMDPLKNVEQKKISVIKVAPRFEGISVSRKSGIQDSPTEAKDGVLKPGTSTFFEDNNTNSENEDAVRNFSQPSTEVSGFSHPPFPAPESLSSSAVLGVSESISESELPNRVVHLSGAAGLGEKKTLNGQVESSSDWVSTSLSLNNEAGQRAKHLKVGKCPLASQSVTTNQSAPTELRQTALVDKDRMNIGAVSLSENAALRGLCESQLPENRSRKEDLDLERTSEEEEERLDGSENNHSQGNKSACEEPDHKMNFLFSNKVNFKVSIFHCRFTLEEEKKKKKDAYTLYEKSKDDLKRKEKQYNEQVDLKQQLESTARALECKLKSVRNKPNQVLEERNDAQRQLSPEQNARVIQDEILAHRLSQQKEAEKANKKMNAEDTMDFELPDPKDSSEVLPQQLLEAERQFRGPEIELHPRRDALRPTTLVLQCVHRDRGQAQRSNKDTEPLSQSKQGDVIKYIAKQALLKETICQLQSENTLLRQQLEVARNEARSENTILNTPEPFLDHMGEVEAMSRRVLMLEEGNKELIKECRCLKDRLCQYEMDRAEMEAQDWKRHTSVLAQECTGPGPGVCSPRSVKAQECKGPGSCRPKCVHALECAVPEVCRPKTEQAQECAGQGVCRPRTVHSQECGNTG
nr:ankyrin repeat domain-containing protein 26-like [Vicugna pacos]